MSGLKYIRLRLLLAPARNDIVHKQIHGARHHWKAMIQRRMAVPDGLNSAAAKRPILASLSTGRIF